MRSSVCMAVFNGAMYLRPQLQSILDQLGPADELIVSDDCSTDASVMIIESMHDQRVRLIKNAKRLGYVRNFERALERASGELVFLSDQDDVWIANKLARMKQALIANPDAAMAHHERILIDAAGRVIGRGPELGDGMRGGMSFVAREFFKPRLWGCALALRASTVRLMLPFPPAVYAHDHWATIVAALSGGVLFVPEPLIEHRAHDANVTPKHGLSWYRRIVVRTRFLQMILYALRRQYVKRNILIK